MENTGLGKYTKSFGISFAITSVLSACLVVFKESHEETVLAWMKSASGHHWATHGIINLVVFAVLGWALSLIGGSRGLKISVNFLIVLIVFAVALSGYIIINFYL